MTLILMDVNKVIKITDVFGFSKLLPDGTFQYPIQGTLVPSNVELYLLNKNPAQVVC